VSVASGIFHFLTLANVIFIAKCQEGYYIGREISEDDPRYDPAKLRGPNQWPAKSILPGFQSTMEDYHSKLTNLAMEVVRLIGLGLGLEESHFDEAFEDSIATLRLLRYDKRESKPEEGIFACGAHSDYGIVTLLLTDENPGLQIQYRGEWIDVPPRPSSFVVNIGGECACFVRAESQDHFCLFEVRLALQRVSALIFLNPNCPPSLPRHARNLDQRSIQEYTPPGPDVF